MPDILAIVSKALFEKAAGKAPKLGAKLALDRYISANKNLEPLHAGGKLFLVTVRPPDEQLWLVAVLDQPRFDGSQWVSTPSEVPLIDISALRAQLRFESGKGITAAPGALGMSLQTPRVLTPADVALLLAAAGATFAPATAGQSDRRAELLAAIIADPDSTIARQVYADELSQEGDPRGELIQLELALSGPLSIRKRDALVRRRDELVKAHAATWWPYTFKYRTHGGFLQAVDSALDVLDEAAGALFAQEPITQVTTYVDDEDAVARLANAPWLARVRHLIVRGYLGDDGFASLVASERVAQLRELNVTATELGPDATAALEDHLPALATLVLTSNELTDSGIEGLVAWEHLGQVETLYLSGCGIGAQGVALLLDRPLPRLEKLTLSNNDLDDDVAAVIAARAANLPELRFLELKGNSVTRAGVDRLLQLPALIRLDVRRNPVGEEQVAPLAPRVRAGR